MDQVDEEFEKVAKTVGDLAEQVRAGERKTKTLQEQTDELETSAKERMDDFEKEAEARATEVLF